MARNQISVISIGLLITLFGFVVIGVGAFTSASGVCFSTSAIEINSATVNPGSVGIGQAFQVSGTIFAGTGCPLSDGNTVYSTYSVYWWIPTLNGYSGSFVVNNAGAFTITNIPTISQAGSYQIVVSPYPQSQQSVCVDTSTFTCTNTLATITVNPAPTVTYPFQFTFAPLDPGATMAIKDSSGTSQYLTVASSSTPVVMLTAGDYSYIFQPNNDPSVVGTQCLNTRSGTFSVGTYDSTTQTTALSYTVSTFSCGPQPSSITFNVEPTVSGTITFNGQTQNIGANGLVTFSNVAAGTYTALITPSSSYPNCLYNSASETLTLPYSSGTLLVSLTASNSQTCQAPITITSTVTTSAHSVITTTNQQGSTYTTASGAASSSTSAGCKFTLNCPSGVKTSINGIEIIGAVIAVFGIFTTFAGSVRGRR